MADKTTVTTMTTPNKFNNFTNQYYAAFIANLMMFAHASVIGWFTPVLPLLKSNETPLLSGPLTLQEISWLGSLTSIGGFISAFTIGHIITRLGVKRTLILLTFPTIIAWLLIIFATNSYHLALSRLMSGISGCSIDQSLVLYVSEIADDRIRGTLGSLQLLSRSVGYLAAFIVGAYTDYSKIPYVFIGLPLLFLVNFVFLPNTPKHLIQSGKFAKAKESLKYYKKCKGKSHQEQQAIEDEFQRLQNVLAQGQKKKSLSLKDCRKPLIMRGLILAVILGIVQQFSGCFTFMTYGVTIFEESGTHVDPQLATILLGVLQCIGNLCTTQLVDSLGRRILLISSISACALGLAVMSIYNYLDLNGFDLSSVHWIPVISLGFVIFVSSVGIMPLTLICVVESLPNEARQFGLSVSMVVIMASAFASTKLFPVVTAAIYLYGSMSIYAVVCSVGVIFIACLFKETKGINLDMIGQKRNSIV